MKRIEEQVLQRKYESKIVAYLYDSIEEYGENPAPGMYEFLFRVFDHFMDDNTIPKAIIDVPWAFKKAEENIVKNSTKLFINNNLSDRFILTSFGYDVEEWSERQQFLEDTGFIDIGKLNSYMYEYEYHSKYEFDSDAEYYGQCLVYNNKAAANFLEQFQWPKCCNFSTADYFEKYMN